MLRAAGDLLAERGYDELTLERIAAEAGVSRRAVSGWWGSKAELLVEAYATIVAEELRRPETDDLAADVRAYLGAVAAFLSAPAGTVFRVLVAEAQRDCGVAELLRSRYGIERPLEARLEAAVVAEIAPEGVGVAALRARLLGPVLYRALVTGEPLDAAFLGGVVAGVLGGR